MSAKGKFLEFCAGGKIGEKISLAWEKCLGFFSQECKVARKAMAKKGYNSKIAVIEPAHNTTYVGAERVFDANVGVCEGAIPQFNITAKEVGEIKRFTRPVHMIQPEGTEGGRKVFATLTEDTSVFTPAFGTPEYNVGVREWTTQQLRGVKSPNATRQVLKFEAANGETQTITGNEAIAKHMENAFGYYRAMHPGITINPIRRV